VNQVDTFLENAQRIFDVARMDSGAESSDFALLVRPDGSLHVVMETSLNLDAVAIENGAQTAYRVSRSQNGVRVSGRNGGTRCELTCDSIGGLRSGSSPLALLRDQPLYLLSGQSLLTSARIASAS
jgi:hypothetical protein